MGDIKARRLFVRLPAETLDKVRVDAKQRQMTVSAHVRQALEAWPLSPVLILPDNGSDDVARESKG